MGKRLYDDDVDDGGDLQNFQSAAAATVQSAQKAGGDDTSSSRKREKRKKKKRRLVFPNRHNLIHIPNCCHNRDLFFVIAAFSPCSALYRAVARSLLSSHPKKARTVCCVSGVKVASNCPASRPAVCTSCLVARTICVAMLPCSVSASSACATYVKH